MTHNEFFRFDCLKNLLEIFNLEIIQRTVYKEYVFKKNLEVVIFMIREIIEIVIFNYL